ncbi:TetR family transcriptional regulator [Actinocorallia herbida]|uniref:TetR family transcriptional regulator n=1 Tax=Actinocorallia herbida TaxID=58109 RepID=A0A3N1D655_9ACTN|nr:TetR/AcrR family transcriptional regulator [Actinocorallia herbida]ROO89017.1 TetR family transcriptional regulator [Actinocorallia herbida]
MPKIQAATVAEHRALRRRALLDAARAILAETGGKEPPGLGAVAERAGLARPSVYQYFKSRDALLAALIEDMFPQWTAFVNARMDEAEGDGAKILAYVEANLHLVASGEHAIVQALATLADSEVVMRSSGALHEGLRGPLVAALAAHGAARPEETADLLHSIVLRAGRMIEEGLDERAASGLVRELLGPYLRLTP